MELIKSQVISISYLRMDRYALHYNLDIISLHCRGALAPAKRSGAPWVTTFGKLSIRENLVMT